MRAILVAALLAAGCTLSPDVSKFEPKSASDCPGRKACGYLCVDADDPAAGCAATTCEPCAAGPDHTASICLPGGLCGSTCAPGFADCDGNTGNGCERPVASDAANCGACGRTCAGTCAGGECQVTPTELVADSGEEPRGIAIAGTELAWVTDPPVAGGVDPVGVLYRAPLAGGTGTATPGFAPGHGTWVTGAGGRPVIVSGSESGYYDCWLVDPDDLVGTPLSVCGWRDFPTVAVLSAEWSCFVDVGGTDLYCDALHQSYSSGSSRFPDLVYTIGRGSGFFWLASSIGIIRYTEGDTVDAPDVVSGGGVYFAGLASPPRPDRVAARAEPTGDVKVLYFLDLTDGSVWTGRTTGPGNNPWRLVRGNGPRSQMDLAADDLGAVWSDLDRGEIWAATPAGQIYRVASGVRPWAIALTADTVYFTDVDAQAIRSVPR